MIGKLFQWLRGPSNIKPLPDTLWQEALDQLPFLDRLDSAEKARLRQLATAFLAEKEFTSAGGLELSDSICASIAVQGCLPILNLGLENYGDWIGIIVYPDQFIIPRIVEDEFGVVHEYNDIAAGEAWENGPLLVSWRDAQMAGEGYNVVIHEFAHKLDMLNGEADGLPPLPDGLSRKEWKDTLTAAYEDFCARLDEAGAQDKPLPFDPYAAESPGEFFAVMSEHFFETPGVLREEYPPLYEQLKLFYKQDPAAGRQSD